MKNLIKFIPLLTLAIFSLGSCEKAYLTKKEVIITEDVSYTADIQPIFNADCATSNCHVSGAVSPNLTASKSYDELTQLGYVDTTNATESILYKLITSTTNPMPPSDPLSADEIGYILAWIEQGAQNN